MVAVSASKIKAIIFDLDGTLVDTEPAAGQAIVECFRQWGITVSQEDAHFITGRTWETAFQYLFKKYPISLPASEASSIVVSRYRELITTQLFPVQGGAQAVRALAREFPLGLVSGSYRSEILWALDRLGVREHFEVILGAEDYSRSKPAPDGYLKAFEMMKLKGENVLVFEDSEAGITSAKTAGAMVIAITGTNHLRQSQALADHSIADLTGVTPQWLRKLS